MVGSDSGGFVDEEKTIHTANPNIQIPNPNIVLITKIKVPCWILDLGYWILFLRFFLIEPMKKLFHFLAHFRRFIVVEFQVGHKTELNARR